MTSKYLKEIAQLRNCDTEAARAYCLQVQNLCIQAPSFSNIATATSQIFKSKSTYTLLEVAERASILIGWRNNIKQLTFSEDRASEVTFQTIPTTVNTIQIDFDHINKSLTELLNPLELALEEVRQNAEAYSDKLHLVATESVRNQLFATSLAGMIIGATGEHPFRSEHLEDLITKLNGVVDHTEIPWGEQDFIVLGRSDLDEEYLRESRIHSPATKCLTQEEFLNLVLFGVEPDYTDRYRSLRHAGLNFMDNLPQPQLTWTNADISPGLGAEVEPDTSGWQEEHRLKWEFGYTVGARENLSIVERRKRLNSAIQPPPKGLGLMTVAYHIAGQIILSKNRPERNKAIQKWKQDLDWLYKTYYKGVSSNSHNFRWPKP